MTFIPVILSGGSGSRLWPRSRELTPKQLLSHDGGDTLLQRTATRLARLPEAGSPMVVCNVQHCPQVVEQLAGAGIEPLLMLEEPAGRSTAPALAVAAIAARQLGRDPVLLAVPADHVIADEVAFKEAVMAALPHAEKGRLVTLGVTPDTPHTGFGYIRVGEELAPGANRVAEFVEKPDAHTARRYVGSGEYLWNSGMLVARASALLDQLRVHGPEVATAAVAAVAAAVRDGDRLTLDASAFSTAPALSMETAVLEHTSAAAVVPLQGGWSDLGSWSALWDVSAGDERGNVLVGDVVPVATRNTLIHAESRLVATAGVDDLVVVETPDAVLVVHRDRTEEVKAVVEELRRQGRAEVVTHRRVSRPWGSYEVLSTGPRSQVKRLTVEPGSRLSLQRHRHRAEYWVVTAGTALVQLDGEEIMLHETESIFVPLGATHRITNAGHIPLEIIEVQMGAYLGEDDIIRLEDDYGRGA